MRVLVIQLVLLLTAAPLSAQPATESPPAAAAPAAAVEQPTLWMLHGQIRPRVEFRYNNLFNLPGGSARYLRPDNGDTLSLRSRVGFGFDGPKFDGIFQLQHVSRWGITGGDETTDPGVGMHQASVTWSPNDWWWLQLGRFEIAYGDERVLGAPGWNQTGRSWDGVRMGVRLEEDIGLDAFAAMYDEGAFRGSATYAGRIFEDDSFLTGLYFHSDYLWEYLTRIDVYVLGDFQTDQLNRGPQRQALATLGSRLSNEWFVIEGAYQTGTRCVPDPAVGSDCLDVDPDDIHAGFFDMELGIDVGPVRPFVGGGYATGDNPATSRQEGYFHMYPRAHKWLGHIDIIGPRTNVIEVRGGATAKIEGLRLTESVHYFRVPEPTPAAIGLEFDTKLEYDLHEMLNAGAGYSAFLPFDGASTDPNDQPSGFGSWWWVMLTFDANVVLNSL